MTGENDETAIVRLIGDWTNAICDGDIDGAIANRTDDIVMFDVPEPAQEEGIEAYRQTWKLFFAHTAPGPHRFRVRNLRIVAKNDLAVAHGLLTIGRSRTHCRLTIGLRKISGRWLVFHEHHSMPIKIRESRE